METKNADLSSLKIDRSQKNVNPEQKGKLIKMIAAGLAITIILIVIVLLFKSYTSPAVEVKMTYAALQSSAQSNAVLTASGYVVAQRKAAVASKGMGRLVYLGVVEGDRVTANQVIARLEDSDIKAQLDQAKANLKLSQADLNDVEKNYNRQKDLLRTGSVTQMEFDAAESRYNRVLASIEVAKALVTQSEVALENTLVRAPFNGTVLTKNADVGEVVAPMSAGVNSRAAVVTMADMNSLQVEADVSESNIEKIEPDQNCQITLDAYPRHNYAGYVAKIVPTADRGKATVMVKVGFKNYDKRVLPEMSAKVLFLREAMKEELKEEKPNLVVPKTAVVTRGAQQFAFKVRDDKVVQVAVTTGKDFGLYIEITNGLENGDEVIDNVTDEIKDGVKVKINK
ncbi:MAG: efflux RND transporter periplasmic adaptor subunit [Ignavibacteriales bacterium]|nr:efflux RND transporter periplasmic adaptor subunit [Ignavibacteriales bacterium]